MTKSVEIGDTIESYVMRISPRAVNVNAQVPEAECHKNSTKLMQIRQLIRRYDSTATLQKQSESHRGASAPLTAPLAAPG
jgi:hypothetical protein